MPRRKTPTLWTLVGIAAVALTVSCATVKVRTDFDTDVDFAGYGTYDWLEPPVLTEPAAQESVDPFARNSLLDKRVRREVDRVLAARGYRRVTDGNSAFLVHYQVILENRTKIRSNSIGGGYYGGYYRHGYLGGGYSGGTYSYDYKEGTLILDVIDSRTERISWRGWAVGTNREGYYTEELVAKAVGGVLAEFPPGGAQPLPGDDEHLRSRVKELEERLQELEGDGGG